MIEKLKLKEFSFPLFTILSSVLTYQDFIILTTQFKVCLSSRVSSDTFFFKFVQCCDRFRYSYPSTFRVFIQKCSETENKTLHKQV